jgi:hypothetical protein
MTKQFNNTAGTTSSEFHLGAGTGSEVRQFVLTADVAGTPVNAVDRAGNEIEIVGIEFYEIKMLAQDSAGIVARQLRGTVNGTTVTRITDTFQEDFDGDINLTSTGTVLSIECQSTTNAKFTISVTLTRVSA